MHSQCDMQIMYFQSGTVIAQSYFDTWHVRSNSLKTESISPCWQRFVWAYVKQQFALGCGHNKQSKTTKKRWSWVTVEPPCGRDLKANKLTTGYKTKHGNHASQSLRVAVEPRLTYSHPVHAPIKRHILYHLRSLLVSSALTAIVVGVVAQ